MRERVAHARAREREQREQERARESKREQEGSREREKGAGGRERDGADPKIFHHDPKNISTIQEYTNYIESIVHTDTTQTQHRHHTDTT